MKMKGLDWLAGILVVVGAINWGLVGAFNFDLVAFLLGSMPMVAKIVYIAVGLSGVWMIFTGMKCCRS